MVSYNCTSVDLLAGCYIRKGNVCGNDFCFLIENCQMRKS